MFRLVFVPIFLAGSGPYSGTAGGTDVTVPRLAEAGVMVDGRLSEDAAIKLTGKVSGFGLGILSGVDDRAYSASGTDNPVYNIVRARRDLGGASTLGLVYTDKIDGSDYNRVAGTDARIVFGKAYTARAQVAGSFTRRAGRRFDAPLWAVSVDRSGREFGFTYSLGGIDPDFVAASGFVSRAGIATATIDHHVTRYGRPGAAVEAWTGDVLLFGRWRYPNFTAGHAPDDQEIHFNTTWVVRGWSVNTGLFIESFHYDPRSTRTIASSIRPWD